ncbi:hypothetical protein LCL85_00385 [Vibrio alginolyticus]|nr:hypothetical protein [Vibrio alginolyticus]
MQNFLAGSIGKFGHYQVIEYDSTRQRSGAAIPNANSIHSVFLMHNDNT